MKAYGQQVLRGSSSTGPVRLSVPVRQVDASSNCAANRRAVKRMSELERLCGLTLEQYDELHAEQRARVRARWGVS